MQDTVPRPKRTEPVKPGDEISISIRFPGSVYNAVRELSDRERRSFSAQVLYMLEQQLDAAVTQAKRRGEIPSESQEEQS